MESIHSNSHWDSRKPKIFWHFFESHLNFQAKSWEDDQGCSRYPRAIIINFLNLVTLIVNWNIIFIMHILID